MQIFFLDKKQYPASFDTGHFKRIHKTNNLLYEKSHDYFSVYGRSCI